MTEPITDFHGKYDFLSNFYISPFMYEGKEYRSVEHAYQAWKAASPEDAEKIRLAPTPGQAKKLGRSVSLAESAKTEYNRLVAMHKFLWAKFGNPDMVEKLLSTGDAELVEGNWWGDKFWGVCKGEGENYLGHALMAIRAALQDEKYGSKVVDTAPR